MKVVESLAVRQRPKTSKDIVGNNHVLDVINGFFIKRQVPKTLLLIGPTGCGKTTIGRIISKTVNCENLEGVHPCGKCVSCKLFEKGSHPDFMELNIGGEQGKVDDIRKVLQVARLRPRFNFRIFLLDEVDGLTAKSKSEVLKPLEEPPPQTLWILCTMNPEKLPKALYGRCLKLFLSYPIQEEMSKRLKVICKKEFDNKINRSLFPLLDSIVEGCGCQPRNSVSSLEQIASILHSRPDLDVKKLVKEVLFDSGELAGKVVQFLSYIVLKKLSVPLEIASTLDQVRVEEFINMGFRYSNYAILYYIKKRSKERMDTRIFWGINYIRWDKALDKLQKNYKIGEKDYLRLCGSCIEGTEKIRRGLLSPEQALIFLINDFLKGD